MLKRVGNCQRQLLVCDVFTTRLGDISDVWCGNLRNSPFSNTSRFTQTLGFGSIKNRTFTDTTCMHSVSSNSILWTYINFGDRVSQNTNLQTCRSVVHPEVHLECPWRELQGAVVICSKSWLWSYVGVFFSGPTFTNGNTLPKTNSSPLKMDGWKTIVSFWDGLFSGALAVSFREGRTVIEMGVSWNSGFSPQIIHYKIGFSIIF